LDDPSCCDDCSDITLSLQQAKPKQGGALCPNCTIAITPPFSLPEAKARTLPVPTVRPPPLDSVHTLRSVVLLI